MCVCAHVCVCACVCVCLNMGWCTQHAVPSESGTKIIELSFGNLVFRQTNMLIWEKNHNFRWAVFKALVSVGWWLQVLQAVNFLAPQKNYLLVIIIIQELGVPISKRNDMTEGLNIAQMAGEHRDEIGWHNMMVYIYIYIYISLINCLWVGICIHIICKLDWYRYRYRPKVNRFMSQKPAVAPSG